MKRIFLILLCLLTLASTVFAASKSDDDDDKSSSTKLQTNTRDAQKAMAMPDYQVTAGDIYTLVSPAGSYSVTIDSSYKVRVGNLGIINVKGLTYQEFKAKVEAIVINNYPTGVVQLFLTNPAAFNVVLTGEVLKSEEVETWALGRLSDIITGALTDYSSRRDIKIISADGTENVYDLFKAERFGDLSQNPYMHPGDKIIVSKYDRVVTLNGAVRRPGTYYLLPGEQLKDLIDIYGDGYTDEADTENISLRRFVGGKEVWNTRILEEADLLGEMNLFTKDIITVGSVTLIRSIFYIEGAFATGTVTGPAGLNRTYIEFEKGQDYTTVVRNNRSWFTNNSADLEAAYIRRAPRVNPETGEEEREEIAINLKNIIYGTGESEIIPVMPDDTLYIPFIQYYVLVNGAVISVGRYPYQADKDYKYYITLANGFNLDQNLFGAVVIKDKNGKRLSKKSKIPPEATITASRNSPNGGWVVPLIITVLSFITTCLGFYTTIKNFRF